MVGKSFNYKQEVEVVTRMRDLDEYGGFTYVYNTQFTLFARIDKFINEYKDQRYMYYLDNGITVSTIHSIDLTDDTFIRLGTVLYKIVKKVHQRRKYVYLCEELK